MPFLRSISRTTSTLEILDLIQLAAHRRKRPVARRRLRRVDGSVWSRRQRTGSLVAGCTGYFPARKRCSAPDLPPGTVYAAAGRPARRRRSSVRDVARAAAGRRSACARWRAARAAVPTMTSRPAPAATPWSRRGPGRIREASANALGASPARLTWCPFCPEHARRGALNPEIVVDDQDSRGLHRPILPNHLPRPRSPRDQVTRRRGCGPSASCRVPVPPAWVASTSSSRAARARFVAARPLGRRRRRAARAGATEAARAARRSVSAGARRRPDAAGPPKPPERGGPPSRLAPPGPRGGPPGPCAGPPGRGAAEATAAGSRGTPKTAGTWAGRFRLRFLDDDGAGPGSTRPDSFSMDAFAPSSVIVSTKAKPRGRPVSRSRATRTLRSSMPSPVKASRSSCSVTAYERLPMKSRVPIRLSVLLGCCLVLGLMPGRRTVLAY